MKTILLTGFEPFGGEKINPSWEVAHRLDQLEIAGSRVVSRQLSCTFGAAGVELIEQLESLQPDIVINLGQAGGRVNLSLEKVAINWIDARIPDNAQQQPIDKLITPAGPSAFFSNLALKAHCANLAGQGIPASISYSAGTFVCNYVFYKLMEYIAAQPRVIQGGFVHIPYLPEQVVNLAQQPSMALDTLCHGVERLLVSIVSNPRELAISGGTVC